MKNWQKYRNLILEIKCLWQLIDKYMNHKEKYKSWRNFRNKFFIHLEDTNDKLAIKWKEVEKTLQMLIKLHDEIEKIKFDTGEIDGTQYYDEVIGIDDGFDSLVYHLKAAEKYRELGILISKRDKCTFTIDWNGGDWKIIEV